MSRSSSRRKQRAGLGIVLAGLLLAAIVITVNSLLPRPVVPTMTWERLLDFSGLNHTQSLPEGELRVHFIDVGNADSTLVSTGTHHLLIDGGEPADGPEVVDYLQQQGVDRLEYVIATHPDADHIGGLSDVLEAFSVECVLMSCMDEDHMPTSYSYERLLNALLEQDIPVIEAVPGQQYGLGGATLDILGPAGTFTESNNMSVVCRITFGQRRFLMMGDAEKKAENALLQNGADLRADVLKIGHHGSRSSTGSKFLAAVSPTHAVISCGMDNRYGHPHPETLDVLQKNGANIWRTDLSGTIMMTTDGTKLTIAVEQTEEAVA